jgi:hypothetical protein
MFVSSLHYLPGPAVKTTDTAAIRELVQKLCQSSHPLAKSMDYLAEDLESMSKEYRFWQVGAGISYSQQQRQHQHQAMPAGSGLRVGMRRACWQT